MVRMTATVLAAARTPEPREVWILARREGSTREPRADSTRGPGALIRVPEVWTPERRAGWTLDLGVWIQALAEMMTEPAATRTRMTTVSKAQ